jgi:arylsulfatase A-like enzyme
VVGRFLDTLEAAGRLDSAFVIVTSDHSWKKDPDKGERVRDRLRRVPLLMKAPGQREGAVVEAELCLHRLRGLIAGTVGTAPGSAAPLAGCAVP